MTRDRTPRGTIDTVRLCGDKHLHHKQTCLRAQSFIDTTNIFVRDKENHSHKQSVFFAVKRFTFAIEFRVVCPYADVTRDRSNEKFGVIYRRDVIVHAPGTYPGYRRVRRRKLKFLHESASATPRKITSRSLERAIAPNIWTPIGL